MTSLAIIYFRLLPLFTSESIFAALLANIDYLFCISTGTLIGITDVFIVVSNIVVISLVSQKTFLNQQVFLETILKGVDKQNSKKCQNSLNFTTASSAKFRSQHTKLVNFLSTFNQVLCSPFFESFLVGNLAYNAYSFVFIVYNTSHLNLMLRVTYAVWQLLHGCTPIGVATYVVAINRRMYSGRSLLMSILARSAAASKNPKIKLHREQWKLPCYLELLDDGGARSQQRTKTMALGAGVFGAIERRTMCEFALIYIAFLLHFGGLMTEKK